MPIYEYECQACGHEMDALQKISDAPLTDCPACDASALKKKLSAAAFRLKGSGWYETDFKQNGRKNLHDAGTSGDKKAGDSKTSATTETAAKSTGSKDTGAGKAATTSTKASNTKKAA